MGKCVTNLGFEQCDAETVWNGTSCIPVILSTVRNLVIQLVHFQAKNTNDCQGAGKRLIETITGDIKCECEDGWVSHDGNCYQYSTQAWCQEGEILQVQYHINIIDNGLKP